MTAGTTRREGGSERAAPTRRHKDDADHPASGPQLVEDAHHQVKGTWSTTPGIAPRTVT
jgi:hypothetical protein